MENERRRATTAEQSGLYRMMAAVSILHDESLERRIGEIEYGKRDLGMVRKGSQRLLNSIFRTIPAEQLKRIKVNMKMMRYNVGIQKVADHYDEENGRWLSYQACNEIIGALKDHCMVCTKTHAEQRNCKLKKAIEEMPVEFHDDDERSGCRYFTMWADI